MNAQEYLTKIRAQYDLRKELKGNEAKQQPSNAPAPHIPDNVELFNLLNQGGKIVKIINPDGTELNLSKPAYSDGLPNNFGTHPMNAREYLKKAEVLRQLRKRAKEKLQQHQDEQQGQQITPRKDSYSDGNEEFAAYMVCADKGLERVVENLGGRIICDTPMYLTGNYLIELPKTVDIHVGTISAGGSSCCFTYVGKLCS